jgi:hypothetical protein
VLEGCGLGGLTRILGPNAVRHPDLFEEDADGAEGDCRPLL